AECPVPAECHPRNADQCADTGSIGRGFTLHKTITFTVITCNERIDGHHPPMRPVIDIYSIGGVVFQPIVGNPVIHYALGGIEGYLNAAHPIVVDVVSIDFDITTVVYENAIFT